MPTFSDVLATVDVTPGEASQILYSWAANFHDSAPDLAGKLRKAGDDLAYAPPVETHDTAVTRKRVTAE